MRKIKTKTKVLVFILVVCILLIVLINWNNIIYITLPDFKYHYNGYATGSTINMGEKIYEQINKDIYETLEKEWPLYQEKYGAIGGIVSDRGGKYIIYGNIDLRDRILLRGQSIVIVNDNIYPELYFCRQDILNSYKATESK